jgi:putative membrane protein
MKIIINWLILTVAIMATSWLLPGVAVSGFVSALIAALVLGLINTFIKPVVVILTLPVNIITLGLFTFVINALLILLASRIVDGFSVRNFWWALIFSLVLSVIQNILQRIFKDNPKKAEE